MRTKRIVVSVISDLVSDQRVHRTCSLLNEIGFSVILIGRKQKKSLALDERNYRTERVHCYFTKGILQYAEFNMKLFWRLLFKRTDIFLSNDLDTLFPNFLHAKLRSKKLVYDSHEYFTGTPELQDKPIKRKIWKTLEKLLLPRIKYAYTVNKSISELYHKETGITMEVVRNVPLLQADLIEDNENPFPPGKIILLLQGTGINRNRGVEELVKSMTLLPDQFLLVLIGGGDVWEELKDLSHSLNLSTKIKFIEKMSFSLIKKYTAKAHLGLSMDKPFCINYQLSLPNKIFDYIHAGIPVLSSDVIEVKKILEKYRVGTTVRKEEPDIIAQAIISIFENRDQYETWKSNTKTAAKELCWQKERTKLTGIFEPLV